MYFFSLKKIKAQLIERPLTEKETLPYVIATALVYTVVIEILSWGASTGDKAIVFTALDFINLVFGVLVTIFGTIWLYKKNKGDAGNYFLQRYTALGWVVMTRTSLYLIAAVILVFMITGITSNPWSNLFESGVFYLVISVIFYVFFYWYFGKHIADVAEKAAY